MIKPYRLGAGKFLRKNVSGIVLSLLVISTLTLAVNIQPAKAEFGNIYIRADGSVDPPIAPVSSIDNVTYIFTEDIAINGSIIVQRDNIVIDGAGYALQGTESEEGIYLWGRSNVAIRNIEIRAGCGIKLDYSSNNTISGNNITNNAFGIDLEHSNNTVISRNNITNNAMGVWLSSSFNNTISANNVTNKQQLLGHLSRLFLS